MPRETSPYIVGDFWLDKRRDGESPDIWQATTYRPGSRQIVYRSTKRKSLEDAKLWLHSYVDKQRSAQAQPVEEAKFVPAIFNYWEEHGKNAERPDCIATSLRHFIGFLMQDDAGVGLTIAQADRALFTRFIKWRMAPHSYEVPWGQKTFKYDGQGVCGETVHSDLARVGATINRQLDFGRIPIAPKVPSVDKRLRSQPREFLYTLDQMGAIMMVAAYDPPMFRFLALQLATLVRPTAGLAFDPRTQYSATTGLVDLHPRTRVRTQKRNPIIPAIPEIKPLFDRWAADGADIVKSRKRAWRTIRRVLALPKEAEPKTLRYSVATILRNRFKLTVPKEDIELLLGHRIFKGPTGRYAKYDPDYMAETTAALSTVYREVMTAAYAWGAVHLLSKTGNDETVALDRNSEKARILLAKYGAAYRTRTCDPRITNARKRRKSHVSREDRAKRSKNP